MSGKKLCMLLLVPAVCSLIILGVFSQGPHVAKVPAGYIHGHMSSSMPLGILTQVPQPVKHWQVVPKSEIMYDFGNASASARENSGITVRSMDVCSFEKPIQKGTDSDTVPSMIYLPAPMNMMAQIK